jgi:hypothetical protein
MADGFRAYVAECAGEVPSAFRRGMIVVTILANAIVVAALYLGWHLSAFSALQLVSAGVLFALLEVLIFFPYRLWKSNKAEIAALKTPGVPFPDWRIRELFYFIRPDGILDDNNWETVGADVLDKLSTGQITAWGRLKGGPLRRPLQRLDVSFWNNARFTYTFLADDKDDDSTHAYYADLTQEHRYSDIQFNKAHAMRIWMK